VGLKIKQGTSANKDYVSAIYFSSMALFSGEHVTSELNISADIN